MHGPAIWLVGLFCCLWKTTQYLVKQFNTILSWFSGYSFPFSCLLLNLEGTRGTRSRFNYEGGLALRWSHYVSAHCALLFSSYNLTYPPLPQWSLSLRGGILDVQFTSKDHSNGLGSSRPGYLYRNMSPIIKTNFCYYVPRDPNYELATAQTLPCSANK